MFLLTIEKQAWARDMDKNCCKNYSLVARVLNADSADDILFDANDDVDPGGLSNYKYSDIIILEDGNKIIDILGSIEVGCV